MGETTIRQPHVHSGLNAGVPHELLLPFRPTMNDRYDGYLGAGVAVTIPTSGLSRVRGECARQFVWLLTLAAG
jgi:hypothetical protein